ncbi:hypothetical protein K1719_006482 [Acacia pycnantha]|nr:hypothetical protein K1719_006482 [Acacia pycnantha]
MTVFMFALAIPYDHWTRKENRIGFVAVYALTFFFANFGPNATTFIVAVEVFPARFRSTCHGISAASGKLGAIVGSFGFLYLAQNKDKSKADAGYPAQAFTQNMSDKYFSKLPPPFNSIIKDEWYKVHPTVTQGIAPTIQDKAPNHVVSGA